MTFEREMTMNETANDAVAPLGPTDDSDHHPDGASLLAAESAALPGLPDDLPGDGYETAAWRREVAEYVAEQSVPFTVDDVLVDGLHMMRGGIERGDQMRVAAILRALGYEKQQRRVSGERQNLWSRPAQSGEAAAPHEPTGADQPLAAPEEGGSIIGDAIEETPAEHDNGAPAPGAPSPDDAPPASASMRYLNLCNRETDIKRKLADANRVLHFAQDARKKSALAAVDGGFAAEAAYYTAVDADKAARAHVEQLTAALAQIGQDIQRASQYAVAERRVQQCKAVRDDARNVEGYGPRIEGLLAELGTAVSGYLHDINVVFRKSLPVMTGARDVAAPQTEPVACALLGHFLRSSGLDPAFFIELTSHGMNGLLRYETPSQIVDMQLGNVTERLADNYPGLIEVEEVKVEPDAEDSDRRAEALEPGHELVPAGIFPATHHAAEEN